MYLIVTDSDYLRLANEVIGTNVQDTFECRECYIVRGKDLKYLKFLPNSVEKLTEEYFENDKNWKSFDEWEY